MRMFFILLVSIFCFSFRPSPEKEVSNSRPGFYIFVEDFTDDTNYKYIVETKDSVKNIFNYFFNAELELGDVDRPITIYNGKQNFYIARVTIFENSNGKKNFKHLKYPNVHNKRSKFSLLPCNSRKKVFPPQLQVLAGKNLLALFHQPGNQ